MVLGLCTRDYERQMSREINRHENVVLVFTVQQDDCNSPPVQYIFYKEQNKKSSKTLNAKKKELGEGEGNTS